jgi:hypothetical protein
MVEEVAALKNTIRRQIAKIHAQAESTARRNRDLPTKTNINEEMRMLNGRGMVLHNIKRGRSPCQTTRQFSIFFTQQDHVREYSTLVVLLLLVCGTMNGIPIHSGCLVWHPIRQLSSAANVVGYLYPNT